MDRSRDAAARPRGLCSRLLESRPMSARPPADTPAQLSLFDDAALVPTVAVVSAIAPVAPMVPKLPPPFFNHPRAHRQIRLREHLVAYELRRARRRSIGFVVGPEGLTVSAPKWVGLGEVESALREKERWMTCTVSSNRSCLDSTWRHR